MSFAASALKDACKRLEASGHKRTDTGDFAYYDSMQERLNCNIQENIFPHWRKHQSLKGNWYICLTLCRLAEHELPHYAWKSAFK